MLMKRSVSLHRVYGDHMLKSHEQILELYMNLANTSPSASINSDGQGTK